MVSGEDIEEGTRLEKSRILINKLSINSNQKEDNEDEDKEDASDHGENRAYTPLIISRVG